MVSRTPSAIASARCRSRRNGSWRSWHDPPDPPADGDHQRPALRSYRRARRTDDDRRAARDARPHRLASGLRHRHLSCLRGDLGSRRSDQRGGADLHHRRRLLRRQTHPHHRGHRPQQRQGRSPRALSGAAGLPGPVQLPMRILHAGLRQCRHRADRAAQTRAGAARRGRGDGGRGAGETYLPLHRIRALLPSGTRRDPRDPRPDAGRRMMVRRIGRPVVSIAAIVLIAGIAAAAFAMRNLWSGKTGGPVQAVSARGDVAAREKYRPAPADCAACHTAPGGAPYAGGLAMPSGFGTIYATNITPDPDDGIGRWSAEGFWLVLHDGIRRDGQQLYPAMPYTSYRGMTRADADAIYAYVMQLLPMKVANRGTELNFPFNVRVGLLAWHVLFLHDSLPAVSAGSSPAWQRGRYLVNVLGHCGECHTPRGIAGEMELSRALTGFALSRVAAPDITPAGLASRGWTVAGLRAYLGRGLARQGSAFGDMHPVIMLSTRNLTAEDLDAVTTYLLGDNPPPPAPLPPPDATESAEAASGAGRMSYVALCAGCHGLDGNGVPNTWGEV